MRIASVETSAIGNAGSGLATRVMLSYSSAVDERLFSELVDLRDRLRSFAKDRDWEQFHTPRNLPTALAVEAAELLEPFRWSSSGDLSELDENKREALRHEAADILICLVQFADKAGIDLYQAAVSKIELNAQRYPADKVRGSSRKYSEYE
jgi:NTP pyrophosphatase (non-canonical NTP hydrolase)